MLSGKLVKIIKASRDSYWYADKIGQEFSVSCILDNNQYVILESYDRVNWIPSKRFIDVHDTETISYVLFETLYSAQIIIK